MAGDVVNIKVCSLLKLFSGLTGKCYATCHYSFNTKTFPVSQNPTKTASDLTTLFTD